MVDNNTARPKPPYLLGLLCLIPFLGGLAGLIILLLALVYYKNTWLAIIGGAGMLLGIVAIVMLFSSIFRSNVFKQGFEQISQMQLNEVVKDIEFYKLENGQYPGTLADLADGKKMAPIVDPSQNFLGKERYYNYKKIGNKYTVFSSGRDGIPYTNDDRYPDVTIRDSSGIGFIREK